MARIDVNHQDLLAAYEAFFGAVLKLDEVTAVLVPRRLKAKNMVMPTLVSDPQALAGIDPLAPAFPLNAAKIVSRLSRKPAGGTTVAMLRPCEIRAFVELVKLHQGSTEELILISTDCLGAFTNSDYFRFVGDDPAVSTLRFVRSVLEEGRVNVDGVDLASACRACEYPVALGADINMALFGVDTQHQLLIEPLTEKGQAFVERLALPSAPEPGGRAAAIEKLLAERRQFRDHMFEQTRAATDSLEKLGAYLAHCVNCYNCRVACPVCYCRECVFVTDVFEHDPSQYLGWAVRKGAVKMPTDTVFYHLTRLAHMSTACVGCGQCSNACPNGIDVMELFRTVARRTQESFGYAAGCSWEEKPPLSEFRENEFSEVVGIE
jgi:formate dehydrogenase subunit beta